MANVEQLDIMLVVVGNRRLKVTWLIHIISDLILDDIFLILVGTYRVTWLVCFCIILILILFILLMLLVGIYRSISSRGYIDTKCSNPYSVTTRRRTRISRSLVELS